jgi:hypothetical protein
MRELRAMYSAAHREGMAALEQRELEQLDHVIRRERSILEEQMMLISQLRALGNQDLDQ